jgi:capsular polysaccharide transport system permease protein
MRSGWRIQRDVMHALFLREAVNRISGGRTAWVWLLLEPVTHVVFIMTLFGFILHKITAGVDGAMFVATGLLGFFVARNVAARCIEAVKANSALFAYRQVKPVDAVLVRAGLEGTLAFMSAVVLLSLASLFGFAAMPHDLFIVLAAYFGMWACGTGLGLILSVANELIPGANKAVGLLFRPLYFISGVMFPMTAIPQPYREWMLYNPLSHGLELLRAGYFSQYHTADGVSFGTLYGFALVTIFLGLALHVRFAQKMIAQ